MALFNKPPIGNLFFEYQLSTNRGKFKNLIGKGHTGNSSRRWVSVA